MKVLIGVNGACGRMGQRIVQLAHEDKSLEVAAAREAAGHPNVGHDIGEVCGIGKLGVAVQPGLPADRQPAVIIDFSHPIGTMAALALCLERRIPLLVATTGHTARAEASRSRRPRRRSHC